MLNPPCCDCKVLCPDPADPINNLTAERPDPELFIGYSHGSAQQPPPTGWTWGTPGCVSFCTSTVSQADADLCAARQQFTCTTQDCDDPSCTGGGGDGGWHAPGQPGNPAVFANTPQSCAAECPDGFPFTYTLPANQVFQLNQSYANQVAESIACNLADQSKLCLSDINGGACVNQLFNGVITASGGSGTFSFSIIFGSLPVGITATQIVDTFVLSGTPLFPGNYTFTVRCVDSLGSFMNKNYTIFVLGLTSFPTTGNVGSAYNFTFTAAGGVPPFTFSIVSGSLPTGLSMTPSGIISGTPTGAGTSKFGLLITDSAGNTCQEPVSITTSGACPDWSTLSWGGTYFEGSAGGGTESISPGAAGSSAAFSSSVDGNVFGGSATTRNSGTLSYNGPACNCNLHVVVTANTGVVTAQIQITDTITGLLVFQNQGTIPVGTYDFPFALAGGGPDTITVSMQLQTAAGPVPRSFHFSALLTHS